VVIDPVALDAEFAGDGRGVDIRGSEEGRGRREQLDHAAGDRLHQSGIGIEGPAWVTRFSGTGDRDRGTRCERS
jgi:hypothetical protein